MYYICSIKLIQYKPLIKKAMETQLRKLQLISKVLNLENFYSINLWADEIKLQGEYNANLAKLLNRLKFKCFCEPSNGFLYFTRNNIIVVLS